MQINVYALYAFDLFDVFLLSTGNNLQQESIITELQNEVHKFPHALEGYVLPYHRSSLSHTTCRLILIK